MASATAQAQPLSAGKLKLMICDDSNIIRRKIERELKIERLQVVSTASNGRLAVEAFKKAQPGVEVHVYEANHGFNCDQRGSYNEAAAKLAKQRTLAFFAQHVG